MQPEDIDQLLERGRYQHLSEATLMFYRDNRLDKIRVALVDAHLRLCLICERRLAFLQDEAEAVAGYVISDEDLEAIQRTVRKLESDNNSPGFMPSEIQRLSSQIKDLWNAWKVAFASEATLGTDDGDEVWRYESKDGLLTAWVILEEDTSLTIHISSPEAVWEGLRILFWLGPFSQEVTFQREDDSRVEAKIRIPRPMRVKQMADIGIEVVGKPE